MTDVRNEPTGGDSMPYVDAGASRSVSLLASDHGESIEPPRQDWPRQLGLPLLAAATLVVVLVLVWTGLNLLGRSMP